MNSTVIKINSNQQQVEQIFTIRRDLMHERDQECFSGQVRSVNRSCQMWKPLEIDFYPEEDESSFYLRETLSCQPEFHSRREERRKKVLMNHAFASETRGARENEFTSFNLEERKKRY
jgi:hypothetical protein